MAPVKLAAVRKVYDTGARTQVAVDGIDLDVADGEFVVLVGPSGCGKSTTLRMVAGLEPVTAGRVFIGEREVTHAPPRDRDVAMVFQSYALYPHMTVFDNLAFGLKMRKIPKPDIHRRVREAAAVLGIGDLLERKPRQLSGGQRQRVALGRALVRQPAVFLFDEPLSNLDAKLRVQMRREIARLHQRLGATMLYVTHDQTEAMTLGDRIVVLSDGHVQQIDAPLALYERPANAFVAGFIGSPAMNLIPGRTTADGACFETDDGELVLPLGAAARAHGVAPVIAGVRPEHLHVSADGPGVPATLELVEPLGSHLLVTLSAGPHELTLRLVPQPLPAPGATLTLAVDPRHIHLFDRRTGRRLGPD